MAVPVGAGGERLAVRLAEPGAAPGRLAILYLHGFGSRQEGEKATYFRAHAVESGLAFCSYDARGHGESDGSMRELTLSHGLEDVAAVRAWLAARGYGRIALFGSSMGGATALWHAARNPSGVVAAVHIAPAVAMLAGLERWAGEEGLARWRREGTIRFANELVECELGWPLVEDLRRLRMDDLVASYRTPTLVFQGRRDETVAWRDVAEFAARVGRKVVELVVYDDGGHRLIEHLPDLWRRAEAFLRAHEAG